MTQDKDKKGKPEHPLFTKIKELLKGKEDKK